MYFSHSARPSAVGSIHSLLATTGTPAWRMTASVALAVPPTIKSDGRALTTRSTSITRPTFANSTTCPALIRACTSGLVTASR